ncbi:hypothetical protein S40293_10846 [Stachybotrys chartarum IBT 40293]|nr:hypothetical protein S40293_10846 [Stachybotrys chartarum IBT 40293]
MPSKRSIQQPRLAVLGRLAFWGGVLSRITLQRPVNLSAPSVPIYSLSWAGLQHPCRLQMLPFPALDWVRLGPCPRRNDQGDLIGSISPWRDAVFACDKLTGQLRPSDISCRCSGLPQDFHDTTPGGHAVEKATQAARLRRLGGRAIDVGQRPHRDASPRSPNPA